MDLFAFAEEITNPIPVIAVIKSQPVLPKQIQYSNDVILKTDYRKGLYTTHMYYSQFVTQEIINLVVTRIGQEAIMKSTKANFSDIRQDTFDNLDGPIYMIIDQEQIKHSGEDIPYMCFNVCVAKAAATIYRNSLNG